LTSPPVARALRATGGVRDRVREAPEAMRARLGAMEVVFAAVLIGLIVVLFP
jgi:hypothetical protein